MNLLSWNCRGLGNPQAVRELCQLTREKKPTILFLMETKCHRNKMEFVHVKLGFVYLFTVDWEGVVDLRCYERIRRWWKFKIIQEDI